VSNPAGPSVVGSVATGSHPWPVAVSGRYAYVANYQSNILQVIDVSNPTGPSVVGSVGTGSAPFGVAVSGRYAYVVNWTSNSLQVIDVSNPAGPSVIGSVTTGGSPWSVAVSGRYAYVANSGSNTVQVIDVSNPAGPSVVGSVGTGSSPQSVAVSGRCAYVANRASSTLQVIDVTGIETTALNAHSLEAGTLQVRGSAFVANQLSVGGGLNVGPGGIFSGGSAAFNGGATFKGNIQVKSASSGLVVAEIGEGLDYAEGFDVSNSDRAAPGTVLVIDPDSPGKLAVSTRAYDRRVAGVVAGANGLGSGVRLGTGKFGHDVALAGRVYCNVDAKYGAVEPGDLLTTSPTPGFAMVVRVHPKAQGAILGKAMQRMAKGGKGQMLVLVTLQ